MARFDDISPLLQKLKCLWQFYKGLFSIWQKLLPTLANFVHNWAIFHGCKWTNDENDKSHLVTLIITRCCFVRFKRHSHSSVEPAPVLRIDAEAVI